MKFIGKACEEHKAYEGIAFEEWYQNSALPSAIFACNGFACTLSSNASLYKRMKTVTRRVVPKAIL